MSRKLIICKCSICGKYFERIFLDRGETVPSDWRGWEKAPLNECMECYIKRVTVKEREEENKKMKITAAVANSGFSNIKDSVFFCLPDCWRGLSRFLEGHQVD